MAGAALRPGLGELLLYLWRLSRPEGWFVSILPAYLGHLVATRELLPGLGLWLAFWSRATAEGATTAGFLDTLTGWLLVSWKFLLLCVIMGPVLWAATILINDVHDLPGDRLNPRKARSPLVQGLVTVGWAHAAAYVAAGIALALAALVSWALLALTLACLALGWAYSVQPLRLKTRPGADVLLNAVGVGGLAAMAGWAAAAPLATFPFAFLPQGMLVVVAMYVPTTLVDHSADKAAGYLTLATHLGPQRAYRIGWWAWVACNAGAMVLSWFDQVLPRRFLPFLLIFVPLLLFEYHAFIGRARDPPELVRGIALCALTFMAVNLVFALMYTGMWL